MNTIIYMLVMLHAQQVLLNYWQSQFNAVPSYIETRAARLKNHEEEF